MKRIKFLISYFILSSVFILFMLEAFSRILKPISPVVKKIDQKGNELKIIYNEKNSFYIQKSSEFEVKTKINKHGNRIVPSTRNDKNKKIIFLGDSFTFGVGLNDRQSIPNQVCLQTEAECINLGWPGSGAIYHFDYFSRYLKDNKLSKENYLIHLILVSTNDAFAGNDITDTKLEYLIKEGKFNKNNNYSKSYLIDFLRYLSQKSNLVRILRINFGASFRKIAFAGSDNISKLDIELFSNYLIKINSQAKKNLINYYPILISPYSELAGNKFYKTKKDLEQFLDFKIYVPDYNIKDKSNLFYKLDGHFNEKGATLISNYIIELVKN